MNNKQLGEALNARGLHNNFELLHKFGDKLSLSTNYSSGDRYSSPRGTNVFGLHASPGLQQMVRGIHQKYFMGKQSTSLPAALAWVKEQMGYDMVKSPFGNYIDPDVRTKALAFVKAETPPPKG